MTFLLTGNHLPNPSDSLLRSSRVRIEVKHELVPGAARGETLPKPVTIQPDDVLELELDQGQRVWMNGQEFLERFGGGPARAAAAAGEPLVLPVPAQLDLSPPGMAARGAVGVTVKSLKVLGIDLADMTATAIAERVDNRTSDKRPALGLLRCPLTVDGFRPVPVEAMSASEAPSLLFIHGTFSSTWGGFGDLWSAPRRKQLAALAKLYGDRVYAFEHATMGESPIDNVLRLLEQLPDGAVLHVVSHSRGGLLGELLCRGALPQLPGEPAAAPAGDEVRQLFSTRELKLFAADEETAGKVAKLGIALARKRIRVERFVRVASPALGTTLASGRLDRVVSVIGNVLGRALPDTPLWDEAGDIGDFIAAVIKERTDPRLLPGLEAMMPESPFIALMNWPEVTVAGALAVIAGDIEPDSFWGKAGVWVLDRFFDSDHDLVVNTPSMYGGFRRAGEAYARFFQGADVNHFNYFRNGDSARALVLALSGEEDPEKQPVRRPAEPIARGVLAKTESPRSLIFVLPGIMGSTLEVGGAEVWLELGGLALGGFGKLKIDSAGVAPKAPIRLYYGELIERLSERHEVIAFPFDWRLPIVEEAKRLADAVSAQLERARARNLPVRILAHSMGGLVARAMIAAHPEVWQGMCALPGSRLLMLGTPTSGSHAITQLLVGQSSTLRKLALLDLTRSQRQLLDIVSCFPGALEMLPADPREDYFSAATWEAYHGADPDRESWALPAPQALERARALQKLIERSPVDRERMVYVAGHAPVTPAGMERDDAGRIRFWATDQGDGRVTWASGIPGDLPVWYMDAQHGDLACHAPAFGALEELLDQGTTTALPREAPVSRAAPTRFPMPPPEEELFPSPEVLAAAALGASPPVHRPARRRREVTVRLIHGDLNYAAHPVMVGHYLGDRLVSAEAALDKALDGALGYRQQLGRYPGPIGSHAVFVNPRRQENRRAKPAGALVVGLGQVGTLTAAQLANTFTPALLEYAMLWRSIGLARDGDDGLGVSALLVGSSTSGIPVADSVFALMTAVKAANRLLEQADGEAPYISAVDVIELWEDRAILAHHALTDFCRFDGRGICFDGTLLKTGDGRRRVSMADASGWWDRLQILGGDRDGCPADGTLRFSALTRRARAEVLLLPTQTELVRRFVADAIRTTRNDRTIGQTLFELLLPYELKLQSPDQDAVLLVVDEAAAQYPWELLADRWADGDQPFVIRCGLLRQLEATEFRAQVNQATGNRALVIGDPQGPYVELPGAQREAGAVGQTLQGGNFEVTRQIRPGSQEVITALFADHYRVLHLAGHGVYELAMDLKASYEVCGQSFTGEQAKAAGFAPEKLTGMVLGDRLVLSAREVRQMRAVPELVFINCCHLGRIDPRLDNRRDDYHLIAANLATELIHMGVRAVIAAGWAVDDAAAGTFATAFYREMLRGQPFGRAVHAARKATYELHAGSNTWGAYQCYGDPDYRLVSDGGDAGEGERDYVTPEEAIADLENLAASLARCSDDECGAAVKQLDAIAALMDKKGGTDRKWLSGRCYAALGRAYGEANRLDRAIELLDKALAAADAGMCLKDLEQLANFRVRHAARLAAEGKGDTALEAIDAGIARIELLNEVGGKTVERLCMLGSAYKRKAWIDRAGRLAALDAMREYYRQAADLARTKGRDDPYPILNHLAADLAMHWQRDPANVAFNADELTQLRTELHRAVAALPGDVGSADDFWKASMLVDAELIGALVGPDGVSDSVTEQLARDYAELVRFATPREIASVRDQFDFLLQMAGRQRNVVKVLDRLMKALPM